MGYSHSNILINQREAALSEIISESAVSFSGFEAETFSLIKSWLSGTQTFTLKTSGSTGIPKEITLSRTQLIHSAKRTIKALSLSADDTALVCLDTKYIAGKMMLVRALEANMKIVAVAPAANPIRDLYMQPDFAAFVPLQLDEIFKHEGSADRLNQFKSIILGGASVNTSLLEKIKKLSCPVYATYGMTETVSHIALQKLNGPDPQDYFETLPGIEIKTDERDCLVIVLPDFPEPVITNDLVMIINNSGFKILGRYDNIINSGGIKLMPETIEKKIESLLTNRNFFVAGIGDDRLGQKLVLVIEGKLQQELPAALKLALAIYEIPKEIFYLDEFVRTETQKINRLQTIEKALKSHG
jgi:O-succinylbenzoic acid--CoA ligase